MSSKTSAKKCRACTRTLGACLGHTAADTAPCDMTAGQCGQSHDARPCAIAANPALLQDLCDCWPEAPDFDAEEIRTWHAVMSRVFEPYATALTRHQLPGQGTLRLTTARRRS